MLHELLLSCSINCEYITGKSITSFGPVVPRVTSAYEHLPLLQLSAVISSSFFSSTLFFSSFSFLLRYYLFYVMYRVSTLMLFTKDSLSSVELFLLLDLSSRTFIVTELRFDRRLLILAVKLPFSLSQNFSHFFILLCYN